MKYTFTATPLATANLAKELKAAGLAVNVYFASTHNLLTSLRRPSNRHYPWLDIIHCDTGLPTGASFHSRLRDIGLRKYTRLVSRREYPVGTNHCRELGWLHETNGIYSPVFTFILPCNGLQGIYKGQEESEVKRTQ